LGIRDADSSDLQKALFRRHGYGKFGAGGSQESLKALIAFVEIQDQTVGRLLRRVAEISLQLDKPRVEGSCSRLEWSNRERWISVSRP
jgi:hypothetical protein